MAIFKSLEPYALFNNMSIFGFLEAGKAKLPLSRAIFRIIDPEKAEELTNSAEEA
jgi:hypothetical protein